MRTPDIQVGTIYAVNVEGLKFRKGRVHERGLPHTRSSIGLSRDRKNDGVRVELLEDVVVWGQTYTKGSMVMLSSRDVQREWGEDDEAKMHKRSEAVDRRDAMRERLAALGVVDRHVYATERHLTPGRLAVEGGMPPLAAEVGTDKITFSHQALGLLLDRVLTPDEAERVGNCLRFAPTRDVSDEGLPYDPDELEALADRIESAHQVEAEGASA